MTDSMGFPGAIGIDGRFDGGDAAAIVGTIMSLSEDYNEMSRYRITICYGVIGKTAPVRHPDKSKWYGQEDRFSRDQLIPMICAGVRIGHHIAIETIYNWHKAKWFLQAWNTKKNGAIDVPTKPWPGADITGPEIWALWLRYKRPWWAWLVVWLLDIETLVGSILWRFKDRKNQVTRNHMLVCITGLRVYPTITMRLAYWLNDWPDLWARWQRHCMEAQEYNTYTLFQNHLNKN